MSLSNPPYASPRSNPPSHSSRDRLLSLPISSYSGPSPTLPPPQISTSPLHPSLPPFFSGRGFDVASPHTPTFRYRDRVRERLLFQSFNLARDQATDGAPCAPCVGNCTMASREIAPLSSNDFSAHTCLLTSLLLSIPPPCVPFRCRGARAFGPPLIPIPHPRAAAPGRRRPRPFRPMKSRATQARPRRTPTGCGGPSTPS